MSCLQGPTVVPPTLPAPISIATPPISAGPFDVALCCKTPPFPFTLAIPPFAASILPASVFTAINAYVGQAVDYINALSVECPFDS